MGYRRYRRKRSMTGQVAGDIAFIANRLSWKGAVIFGAAQFVVFYWLIPEWLNARLNSMQDNIFHPVAATLFARRVHWSQLLALALSLICVFSAIRNYLSSKRLTRNGEKNVSLVSHFLARWLD
jgi:hypothetical protein